MNKRLISILLTFIVLYIVSTYFHNLILDNNDITLPFSIERLYLFLTGYSILICFNLQLFTKIPKIADRIGFIYLGTSLIKIVLFLVVFHPPIILQESLVLPTKLSLLVPIFIFLIMEVFFVTKILNRNR